MNAAARVPRPSNTREPPTSSMTAAYQLGQVPASTVAPLPSAPPRTPKSEEAPWQAKSRPTTMRNRPRTYGWALFRRPVMVGGTPSVGPVRGGTGLGDGTERRTHVRCA
ncbi:hypothetical protein SALBM311S_00775 [Streptomyces alboniger]